MATIKSQMTLNDGMSAVLRKIIKAVDTTLVAFESMQRASGQAVDTKLLEDTHVLLAQAGEGVDEMSRYYEKCAKMEERLNQGIERGTSAADGMLKKVVSLVGAYASISTVKNAASNAMEAADVQIGAQVQLRTVLNNMDASDVYTDMAEAVSSNPLEIQADTTQATSAYDAIVQKAADIQSQGMYGDEAMIAGAAELGTYFSDTEAILSMMDTLTNYAAGMSNGEALDATAMVDYATGIGKIMSGSYDAMTKKGFEFSDVQKAIIEGTATEQQVIDTLGAEYAGLSQEMQAAAVIQEVIDEGWAGLYEAMSSTPFGQVTQLNNALGDVQENIGAGIYPAFLNLVQTVQSRLPQINTAALGLASVLSFMITLLTGLVNGAMDFGTAVADNWSWLEPIVWGLVAALAAYGAYLAITSGLEAVSSAQKGLSAVAAYAAAAANKQLAKSERDEAMSAAAATAAQHGLNAALLACPVTWIVVGIIVLTAAVVAIIRYLDVFGAKSTSVFGTFMGVLNVVRQFVVNVGSSIAAVFWACCSNVETAFHNAIANVRGWWYGLLSDVLTVVEGICAALNKLPFVEFDYSGISAQADEFAAKSAAAYGSVEEYESIGDAWASGWSDNWQKDAFQAGAAWGDGIVDKASSLFDIGTMDDLMAQIPDVPGSGLDGMGSDVSDIADSTGSMAKSLEISGEELEYLRDIAERDAINRFTTAEVKIDMTGMTNRIDGGADLDGVIRELTDGFTEALLTAAEGVHA